jgi:hypothetical protein
MNKNILIRILGISAFSFFIIAGILSLIDGEYFEAIGLFSLAFSLFVFPQWYKKNQP